jgi:23S rRNA-/tRNA-specific pseudouridylate synthase
MLSGKKRGLKPRSQRNRKRPRGGVGIFEPDGTYTASNVQVDILPLCYPPNDKICHERIHVIRPYPFVFSTFAKARWIGKTVLDVFVTEFGSYPVLYYQTAIKEGQILVSGKRVNCDYKIKGQDELSHTVHRHEPAVRIADSESSSLESKPYIQIIHEDEEIIVVDKPSTVPVHPCGSYHFNSMFHILVRQDESLEGKLYNVHRLDRLTSGLTIIAKSTEVAKTLGKCIMNRDGCHKVYLARVKGKFPLNANNDIRLEKELEPCVNGEWRSDKKTNGDELVDSSLGDTEAATCIWITNGQDKVLYDATFHHVFNRNVNIDEMNPDGSFCHDVLWFNLAIPCDIIDHKHGICKAGSGKAAQTAFAVLGYDHETDTTVVIAKPLTGRTHQIRLHLEFLGHPIANDPCYGGELYYGDKNGKIMCEQVLEKMNELDEDFDITERPPNATSSDMPATEKEILSISTFSKKDNESMEEYIQRCCVWCKRSKGQDRSILEFLSRCNGIWLHAFQYSLDGPKGRLSYKTNLPPWVPAFKSVLKTNKI